MYFYIDESGQSGNNLFDEEQPWLYYGLLSSPYDLDVEAKYKILELRKKLSVAELHASELGIGRLIGVIDELEEIYQNFKINFDFFGIKKPDYAVISFFDQIFDQGMNPAVPWTAYWTPLRYVLLLKVASLFDEELARLAWSARIEINAQTAEQTMINVCKKILNKVSDLPDLRSREIVTDALSWAIRNPRKISYNVHSKQNKLEISPNLMGFEYVVFGICKRLELSNLKVQKIIVDQQGQFNNVQKWITETYQKISSFNDSFQNGLFMPTMDLKFMFQIPIQKMTSCDSVGLEIVDIHLWLMKRFCEGKILDRKLAQFLENKFHNCYFDCMSLEAIAERWFKWFENIPEPTDEQLRKGKEFIDLVEEKRKPFVI